MKTASVLALALAACSAAPGPASSPPSLAPTGGVRLEPAAATAALQPAPSIEAADLDGCDPTGTWVAEGSPQNTGTCTAAAPPLHVEVVVRRAAATRFEARHPDGTPLRLERIRGAGGRCELDIEQVTAGGGQTPNLVLFYHLADGGTGLAIRDEYEPSTGDFIPHAGRIRCTEGYDLVVTRGHSPRS